MPDPIKYIIITPVRDEEANIEKTLRSVINQTMLPIEWVVVNDGSTDGTSKIIESYAKNNHWIKLINTNRHGHRNTGTAEIFAFNSGFEQAQGLDFDYVVKLDGDLQCDNTYFEEILSEFIKDPSLGIASGVYYENNGKKWTKVNMPPYHAAGASKVVRRKCFEMIGGFVNERGWDTIDEIKAKYLGWETSHFKNIKFYHLRKEGSGMGNLNTNTMYGEIFYRCGGSLSLFMIKVLHKLILGRQPILSSIYMFYGFLRAFILKQELLISPDEARFYRSLIWRRILKIQN